MKADEFDLLYKIIQEDNPKDDFDYEGYGILDNSTLTKNELKTAVDIMWEIIMSLDSTERDDKYLFSKGLIKSKDIFLAQKEKSSELTSSKKETFDKKVEIFRKKLQNSQPLVEFLIKIKDIL